MRLISWNVLGGGCRIEALCHILASRRPDVIALQEVKIQEIPSFGSYLSKLGFTDMLDSPSGIRGSSKLVGSRKYGVLVASHMPLVRLPVADMPWPERLLSTLVSGPWGELEIHKAYVPPGSSNGWRKIETLEGIYHCLALPSDRPRILCGDFNTPQLETENGEIITWAQWVDKDGDVKFKRSLGERWDLGERNVLQGLEKFELFDTFRRIHGYDVQDYSWYWRAKGRSIGRRFDHVFSSKTLSLLSCRHLHDFRMHGLSDHSAIEYDFEFV